MALSAPLPHPCQHPLIGMVGYARSGKDTAAAALIEQFGYQRLAFADPLKAIARYVGWDGVKDEEGRHLLQQLGAGVRDVIGKDTWVEVIRHQIISTPAPTVITDVRYDNELEMIRKLGGQTWLITRPGVGPANTHISEQLPDRVAASRGWDVYVSNSGSVADLHAQVLAAAAGSPNPAA